MGGWLLLWYTLVVLVQTHEREEEAEWESVTLFFHMVVRSTLTVVVSPDPCVHKLSWKFYVHTTTGT